jgi:hypothetical protein
MLLTATLPVLRSVTVLVSEPPCATPPKSMLVGKTTSTPCCPLHESVTFTVDWVIELLTIRKLPSREPWVEGVQTMSQVVLPPTATVVIWDPVVPVIAT